MAIAIDELKKAVNLAKIYIEPDNLQSLQSDISALFELIKQIEEVDTTNVEPMVSVVEHEITMRGDNVDDGNIAEQIVKNAPLTQENFFLVPKVVE